MEAYFRPDITADREAGARYGYYHLVLLAKTPEGFQNLMRLSSASYTEDYFYQKPSIDWELLQRYSAGLIGSSSCVSGLLPNLLMKGDDNGVVRALKRYQQIFGDDFFLEIQPHDFDEQRLVNKEIIDIGIGLGVPIVATADAHYPYEDWSDTQDVALMIGTGSSLKKRKEDEEAGKDYMKFSGSSFWLMSEDEIAKQFTLNGHNFATSEYISNTQEIADRCEPFYFDKSPKVPKVSKSKLESERIIREWCIEGLERIGKTDDPVYTERLEMELSVMRKLGVFDFFVITGDMVRWAKSDEPLPSVKAKDPTARKRPLRIGAGRGSAAGSLVNYLVRITAVDPIGYDLLFERFLNEYRTELPDIDIDFQHDRRDEVKAYLREKWGEDHVVDVGAYQSFGLKAAVQSVARALDVNYPETMKATNVIPDKTFGETLESLEATLPELKSYFSRHPDVRRHAMRLQGQIKGQSKHPAAVIVTDRPAKELIPMMRGKDGTILTQWSERANGQLIGPNGFLKLDLLPTDGLTVQAKTIESIERRKGIVIDFEDVEQFPFIASPYDVEQDVVEAFASGANIGVFQFGSRGIIGLLRDIKPTNLEHIIAANALYRPGTLENGVAFDYARRKNGIDLYKLPHPDVEEFIGYTFGFMIFQEQVMQMYKVLGLDVLPAESAVFLKVVAKGIARDLDGKQKLKAYEDKFKDGCKAKGIDKKAYDELWDQILQMTTYAFNKSHSTGYAVQAYQDMWLKMRHTLDEYASLLSVETDKVPQIIRESKLFGVKILPPDVNISDVGFTIDLNSIRFGLLAIKNVGDAAISELVAKRPFESLADLEERCVKGKVNKKVKAALYGAGAFDCWGGRSEWILEDGEVIEGTMTDVQKAALEKELIGFSVSRKNDIDIHKDFILSRISSPTELSDLPEDTSVEVGGEILTVKEIVTKKGDTMAFVDVAIGSFEYSLTFFPKQYADSQHMLGEGSVILVIGGYDPERQTVVVEYACTAAQLWEDIKREEANAD